MRTGAEELSLREGAADLQRIIWEEISVEAYQVTTAWASIALGINMLLSLEENEELADAYFVAGYASKNAASEAYAKEGDSKYYAFALNYYFRAKQIYEKVAPRSDKLAYIYMDLSKMKGYDDVTMEDRAKGKSIRIDGSLALSNKALFMWYRLYTDDEFSESSKNAVIGMDLSWYAERGYVNATGFDPFAYDLPWEKIEHLIVPEELKDEWKLPLNGKNEILYGEKCLNRFYKNTPTAPRVEVVDRLLAKAKEML